MAHHRRKKARQFRNNHTGCCKLHKSNCNKDSFAYQTWQEKRAIIGEREQRDDLEVMPVPSRKKKKVKKPFKIESRFVPGRPSFFPRSQEWGTWNKYTTERSRDMALRSLRHKEEVRSLGPLLEFRAV